MKNISIAIVAVLALMLSGCATSTANYRAPTEPSVTNSKMVKQPFDATWDRLVKDLSSDFFVINNIDKNSRLINISFTSQKPSEFVDCGESTRTFKNARGDKTYVYKTADPAVFSATNSQGAAFNVRRSSKLEGRTNIYVAPESGGTLVTVNTRYVVAVNVNAAGFDGAPVGNESTTFDFSTKQGFSNGEIKCYANGAIERRILTAVQQ